MRDRPIARHPLLLSALLIVASSVAILLTGCSESTSPGRQIQAHLQRVAGTGASSSRFAGPQASLTIGAGGPSAPHWSSDLTITSLKVPIFAINIAGSQANVSLYSCSAETN